MYFEINKKIKIRTLNGVQRPDLYEGGAYTSYAPTMPIYTICR